MFLFSNFVNIDIKAVIPTLLVTHEVIFTLDTTHHLAWLYDAVYSICNQILLPMIIKQWCTAFVNELSCVAGMQATTTVEHVEHMPTDRWTQTECNHRVCLNCTITWKLH